MLEQLISRNNMRSALRALGPYSLIDEQRVDDAIVRTESMPAVMLTQDFIRIQVSYSSKRKRNSYSRSMAWPVNDASNPVELAVITRKILDATLAITPRKDPRSVSAKLLHQLYRKRVINHVEELAASTIDGIGKVRLAATIFEEGDQHRSVTFYQYRPHHRVITLRLPLNTMVRIQQWALDAANFH